MNKKWYFIGGLLFSALTVSLFIAINGDNSWWNFSQAEKVEVIFVEDGGRIPAGGPQNGQPYQGETETPQDPGYEETPQYSGSDKNPGKESPPPAPAPYTPPPAQDPITCIQKAFTEPARGSDGKYDRSWVRNVRMSDAYIHSFISATKAQYNSNFNTSSGKRIAILSLMAAGYCPRENNYGRAMKLNPAQLVPTNLVGGREANLDQRSTAWRSLHLGDTYYCSNSDSFKAIRKDVCDVIYQNCGLRSYRNRDCRMADMSHDHNNDRSKPDRPSPGGGEKEVGHGSNQEAGHSADRNGDIGSGPSGVSH